MENVIEIETPSVYQLYEEAHDILKRNMCFKCDRKYVCLRFCSEFNKKKNSLAGIV